MSLPEIVIRLPEWVEHFVTESAQQYPSVESRMALVIELSRRNIANGTGGPFAAAIFRLDNNTLYAPGINLVMSSGFSNAHAEIIAITLAQQLAGTYDLGAAELPPLELVSSTEPCAMCLGAIPWSGIKRVVTGARDEDARAIGFDEGDKPTAWVEGLQHRGIEVMRNVCREEAATVLREYAAQGGEIYNG